MQTAGALFLTFNTFLSPHFWAMGDIVPVSTVALPVVLYPELSYHVPYTAITLIEVLHQWITLYKHGELAKLALFYRFIYSSLYDHYVKQLETHCSIAFATRFQHVMTTSARIFDVTVRVDCCSCRRHADGQNGSDSLEHQ